MKRSLLLFLLILPFFFPRNAFASLIVIDKNGEVVWKVLASEATLGIPKASQIVVKNVVGGSPAESSLVSLLKEGDKFTLSVKEGGQERSLDVTSIGGEIVEIEERPQVRKVKIGVLAGRFLIEEEGTLALTDYPIKIDPARAELSVVTASGIRILPFLPKEALEVAIRAKTFSNMKQGDTMELAEGGRGELTYEILGQKTINIVNLFKFQIPVTTSISAMTGEVLFVEQPAWLRVFGFLFS
ncbi:hypothetical protein A2V56_02405 [Candidatus Woesebacteria bacterium RBG_19FT_COMBO_42_9]|uniref:FecR protein domain-containing protein n=1 Tax=Candidatus Woesebacteria bacterium RBG_16_42_24 TaxID=1802485 RepID=A0A1F7XL23_9BACT|nr:MAG: hypothetical protein A2V97_03225 [Candidatus Woesebacteria bacterium RBG_16_42_24]OGM16974.1 MAG: hypothetical protein A2V56_02405 [Candidatus Woesebacteria bacterium RBG_19FT_COMBO_42_9]OGM68450.1 MAG: hypothetical protein A2985_01480 [Candidatus Woesebacteria bacterium RIFCSPLOWO2_01_FULL_43_11]